MLAIIAAKSKNNVIGKDGKPLLNIKDEQKLFDELTINNTVIMGRRTFDNIWYPFPDRLNIVVSRSTRYSGSNLITVSSLNQALYLATDNAYVMGGYRLYKKVLPLVDMMYITEINSEIKDGDVFFPEFNEEEFNKDLIEENEIHKRYVYTRKNYK